MLFRLQLQLKDFKGTLKIHFIKNRISKIVLRFNSMGLKEKKIDLKMMKANLTLNHDYQRGSNSTIYNCWLPNNLNNVVTSYFGAESSIDVSVRVARPRHDFKSPDHMIR